jgi:hypothetical protein
LRLFGKLVWLLFGIWAVSSLALAEPVARIVSITGGTVSYKTKGGNYQAWIEMPLADGLQLTTGKTSNCVVELYSGGKLALGPNGKFEFGPTESGHFPIHLKQGRLYAAVHKQKEKPVSILTPHGTVGIRGTELAVDVGPDHTDVLVFEGRVDVSTVEGKSLPVNPFEMASLSEDGSLESRKSSADASESWRELSELLDHRNLPRTTNATPIGYYSFQRKPKKTGIVLKVTGLKADRSNGRARFRWKGIKGVKKYALVISSEPDFKTPLWTQNTSSTQTTYPENAKPLKAGTYYCGVTPVADGASTEVVTIKFTVP